MGRGVSDGGTESASGATPTFSVQIGIHNSSPLLRGSEAIVDEAGVVWDGDGIAPHGKRMRQAENPQLMRGVTTGVDWVDSRLSRDANRGASSPLPGAHGDPTAGPSVAPVPPWTGPDKDEATGA